VEALVLTKPEPFSLAQFQSAAASTGRVFLLLQISCFVFTEEKNFADKFLQISKYSTTNRILNNSQDRRRI
jgi:hypothetical protein